MKAYGKVWDKWPVQPGELWNIGPHRVACGDLELGDAGRLLEARSPDAIYCDPPWTPALATGYRTKAGMNRKVEFKLLLQCLLRACAACSGPVFIEMGLGYVEQLVSAAVEAGGREVHRWPIVYYGTRPAVLVEFSWGGEVPVPTGVEGLDDTATPEAVLRQVVEPGAVVFDPCVGMGLTAAAAHAVGAVLLGLELHPHRAACTVDRLAQLSGMVPERVGAWR